MLAQVNEIGPEGHTAIRIAAEHDNLLVLHEMLQHHKSQLQRGSVSENRDINLYGADGLVWKLDMGGPRSRVISAVSDAAACRMP